MIKNHQGQNYIIIKKILPVTPIRSQWAVPYLLYQYVWENSSEYKGLEYGTTFAFKHFMSLMLEDCQVLWSGSIYPEPALSMLQASVRPPDKCG